MHFGRFAYSAFVVALLVMGVKTDAAHAQQNKPIRSGTWYEDRAILTQGTSVLTLAFAQTPTDKFLNVTHVACVITTSSNKAVTLVMLSGGTTSGGNDLDRPYFLLGALTGPATVNNFKYYGLTTDAVFMKYGPGRYPTILVEADNLTSGLDSINVNCKLVGQLSDD